MSWPAIGNNDVVVWSTYDDKGLPHFDQFMRHNPGVMSFVVNAPGGTMEERWRNNDRLLYKWWLEVGRFIPFSRIIYLEWDVLMAIPLEQVFPPGHHFLCRDVMTQEKGHWSWFAEIPLLPEVASLPEKLRDIAAGIAPCGCMCFSRECFKGIMEHEWAVTMFQSDIFCELRIGTLAAAAGYTPTANRANMANVHWTEIPPQNVKLNKPGAWHPVKEPVPAIHLP